MIKELRELIFDICDIDTSIDIEDIMEISKLNSVTETQVHELSKILQKINLRTEGSINWNPPSVNEITVEPEHVVEQNEEPMKENEDVHHERYASLYAAGGKKKMSLDVVLRASEFCSNYIRKHGTKTKIGYKISRLSLNVPLLQFLSEIDPKTRYTPVNVHDFLKGKTAGNITKDFFTVSDDVAAGTIIVPV